MFHRFLSPLIKYPDFRYLFLGQSIGFLGTMITYVCLPFQMYKLTQNASMVGAISLTELLPTLLFALWGGASADRFDRKKLLIVAEIIMFLALLGLTLNAFLPTPHVWPLFVCAFLVMAANAYHRPSMDAMVQKMIDTKDFPVVSALSTLRYTLGGILGPALGGIIIGAYGIGVAYTIDLCTFGISLFSLLMISSSYQAERDPDNQKSRSALQDIKEGLLYAKKNQTLLGTYFIDIAAMTFAYPVALFPILLSFWGVGDSYLGWPMSAMSLGGVVGALATEKLSKVKQRGRMVILAASSWGLCMVVFSLTKNFTFALSLLVMAGMFDCFSGTFRSLIWNEQIPNEMRGRLSGIEMISYTTGPLLGNFRAGTMAHYFGVSNSLFLGGILCMMAVSTVTFLLPRFWHYHAE